MTKPIILFITGVSGAGKTTLFERLRDDSIVEDCVFHDIDEDGVPQVGRGPWREYRVQQLLFDAADRWREGVSTVICGITKPHEVVESPYYPHPGSQVYFLLIDIRATTFERRIKKRIAARPADRFDETFSPGNYGGLVEATRELSRVLKQSVGAQKNGYIVDGDTHDEGEMHAAVLGLIAQLRARGA